ncbi:TcpQ domain-containing protein [Paraburkholderia megapolitana]|uniref:TcpQ domain-containing protein n=1 Tax=Paraburkholderia megapolitana TaxID=420953 RepID=UPI0038BDC7D2
MNSLQVLHASLLRSLATLSAIVLSGCAAGGAGSSPSVDWAPVARQTTGQYMRVCTVPQGMRSANAASVAAALAPNPPGFDLHAGDGTLSAALARWSAAAGATLRWESALQVPVTADSHVAGDLPAAMKSMMAALVEAGYPLTILQVADGKTWIVTDANDRDSRVKTLSQGTVQSGLAQAQPPKGATKGANDAQAH